MLHLKACMIREILSLDGDSCPKNESVSFETFEVTMEDIGLHLIS